MAQYIDKEKLRQKLHEAGGCGASKGSWADGWDKAIDEAIRLLDEQPVVDEELINLGGQGRDKYGR